MSEPGFGDPADHDADKRRRVAEMRDAQESGGGLSLSRPASIFVPALRTARQRSSGGRL
jgi:hypothetical protein